MEAMLDHQNEIDNLVKTCDQNCTCGYVDDLFKEHLVTLSKSQRKMLNAKKTDKELARCMNFVQSTFCQSELYKTLDKEKGDFSFEEAP
jgi:3-methyladenine DNA glycosylase AlkD